MKKTELKKMLKPLIKECIKEVIFEDGVLSGIVAEVAQGMGRPQLVEAQTVAPHPEEEKYASTRQKSLVEQKQRMIDHKRKLLDAIGSEAYNGINLFEGTAPLSSAPPAPGAPAPPQGPLANVAPHDPGVDISGLLGSVGQNWHAHMASRKRE